MSIKEITLMDNIKEMYRDVGLKVPFLTALAAHLDRSVHTLNTHWFARFWAIPESEQVKVVEFMQNWIANKNEENSN